MLMKTHVTNNLINILHNQSINRLINGSISKHRESVKNSLHYHEWKTNFSSIHVSDSAAVDLIEVQQVMVDRRFIQSPAKFLLFQSVNWLVSRRLHVTNHPAGQVSGGPNYCRL